MPSSITQQIQIQLNTNTKTFWKKQLLIVFQASQVPLTCKQVRRGTSLSHALLVERPFPPGPGSWATSLETRQGRPVCSRPSPTELLHYAKSCNGDVKWMVANVWIFPSVGVTTGRVCYQRLVFLLFLPLLQCMSWVTTAVTPHSYNLHLLRLNSFRGGRNLFTALSRRQDDYSLQSLAGKLSKMFIFLGCKF